MSRNRNDRQRSGQIHAAALGMVNKQQHDSLPEAARKSLRVFWQNQLIAATGCTKQTARTHIRRALEDEQQDVLG